MYVDVYVYVYVHLHVYLRVYMYLHLHLYLNLYLYRDAGQSAYGTLSFEAPNRLHRALVCDEDLELEEKKQLVISCGPLDEHAISHWLQLTKKGPCHSTEPS